MSNVEINSAELYDAVKQWAVDRNLLGDNRQTTFNKQLLKTYEELGELISAWFRKDYDKAVDALGDTLVTLIISNEIHRERGMYFLENNCIEIAEREATFSPTYVETEPEMFFNVLRALHNYHEGESAYKVLVELAILANSLSLNMQYSLLTAYSQIKDRKGETRDGVFVKEEDLNGGDNAQDSPDSSVGNGTSESRIEDTAGNEKTNSLPDELAFEPAPVPDEQGVEGFVETTDGQADTEAAGEAERPYTSATEEDETPADTGGTASEGDDVEVKRPTE